MQAGNLASPARAFDSIAGEFDERFDPWLSIAAQRRAVRSALANAFAPGSRLIEIGGGTGGDACWLAEQGYDVLLTDPSPAMVRVACGKGVRAEVANAERLQDLAEGPFDGAYSNFAALNCVPDLAPFAQGLARLLRPGAPALLVLFGTFCPGEMIVEALRGRPGNMFRRMSRGAVPARLGGQDFTVRYHRAASLAEAMTPWFSPEGPEGIGVFVPPSAAEPWISRHPRLLARLERLDGVFSRRLAMFGDHVLYRFRRTEAKAP